jgi:hypothetical protein
MAEIILLTQIFDNPLTNGGAAGHTDWIDTNEDGRADNWDQVTSSTAIWSIVTGNGFTGNAQRIEEDNESNNAVIDHTNAMSGLVEGKTYKFSCKYRLSAGTFRLRYYSGHTALTLGSANTGDAVYVENTFTHLGYHASMYLGSTDCGAGGWCEIDEVSLVEVYLESPVYRNGGLLRFNGSSEYFTKAPIDFGTGDFSIEAWIKPFTSQNAQLFSMHDASNDRCDMYINDSQQAGLYCVVGGASAATVLSSGSAITVGEWNHISVVADRSTGTYVYVNAVDISDTGSFDSGANTANYTNDVNIGRAGAGTSYFDGQIAEMRISDSARTANQIECSYGAPKGWNVLYNNDTVENDNFEMKATNNGTQGYVSGLFTGSLLDASSIYLFRYIYRTQSGDEGRTTLRLNPSGDYPPYMPAPGLDTGGQYLTREGYFNTGSDTSFRFYFHPVASNDVAWLKNVSVRKILTPSTSDVSEDFSNSGTNGQFGGNLQIDGANHPYAFTYDAASNYIDYGNILTPIVDDMIAFGWIRTTNGASSYRGIITKFTSTGANRGWYLGMYTGNMVVLMSSDGAAGDGYWTPSGGNLDNEGWIFTAFSYDGSTQRAFINGAEIDSNSYTGGINPSCTSVVRVGAKGDGDYWDGQIGDTGVILFDGNGGRPSSLPTNYEDWISRIYNATKSKYTETN